MPESLASSQHARCVGQVLVLAAAYFAAAKLALLLAIPPGYATPVWPSSGIAVAALLLFGNRTWAGVWLGATLVNLTVETSPVAALLIGTGNTLEALAGASLIRRFCGDARYFERGEHVVGFVVAAALSATVAATIAMAPLSAGHALTLQQAASNWWTWWQGDVSGVIIVTPLILSWAAPGRVAWSRARVMEAAAFGVLLLLVARIAFGPGPGSPALSPLMFLIVPFIIWAAFRFSQREVTTAIAVVCALAVWDLYESAGELASLNEALLMLLAFNSTAVVTGLVLCAVLADRDRVMQAIRGQRDELETQVEQRTGELAAANRALHADVAELRHMEVRLVESERRFRSMIESVEDYAIFLLDPDGRVASWNRGAQRIKGYTADEIIGRPYACFYPREDVEDGRPQQALERAARDGRYEHEGWRVRKDGSRFWANAIITALRDEAGRLTGYAKVTRNLTRRKETEEALLAAKSAAEKANQAKSEFLASMSHELRTPLNSLLILAQLLADNREGNLRPKQVKYAQTIHDAGMDLLYLINDILDLARIESGAPIVLNVGPVPLGDLRNYVESNFRQVAQHHHLDFSITIAEDLPAAVQTDARRLQQILKNLLANAFKFTKHGEVVLHIAPAAWSAGKGSADAPRDGIAFTVKDTGIGIPADKLEIIFHAFQQAESAIGHQFGGTGLGLSITREFVRLLGGGIRVESEPGRGSTFTVWLPHDREDAAGGGSDPMPVSTAHRA